MTVHPLPQPADEPDPVAVLASFTESLIGVVTGVFISAFGDMTVGELLEAAKDVPLKDVISALLNEDAA